jgi:hypothetical protein
MVKLPELAAGEEIDRKSATKIYRNREEIERNYGGNREVTEVTE